ncbi:MAG: DUF1385 domain-containing protein [Firmicutes bacterium]|nr:DUF1385 domain-containing protein [Bacillota bacterium]
MIYVSVALAIVLAVGIFMLLPVWLGSFFRPLLGGSTWALGIIEGLIRIAIFLLYVYLISLSKDIRRVYQYHGAEHKTINCYESGDELCVANVRGRSRLHKRCGTSFLLIVMLISMIVFFFVRTGSVPLRILSRLILVPVIAGLSYEVIRWAGRNDNRFVRIVSFPGMCVQRMTTAEPDDGQIETAIAAMNGVLEAEPDKPADSGKPKEIYQPDGPSMDAAVEHVGDAGFIGNNDPAEHTAPVEHNEP